jgi:Uma2 family endonuclease
MTPALLPYNGLVSGSDDVRPSAARVKLTYEDFLLFPDDGKRHELIDGEHYVTPSPNTRHQRILGRLYLLIANWLHEHPLGQLFFAPFDVVLSNVDVVEPDLLYMSNERAAEILTEKHVSGVPELVIEVAAPGTRKRDEILKRRRYEHFGVSGYWIVDPDINVIRVFRRSGGRFTRALELSAEAGDVLTTALLPGLEIALAQLLAEGA